MVVTTRALVGVLDWYEQQILMLMFMVIFVL